MSDESPLLPAATILLLRDGPTGLETFMVVRHHQIDFASGALVFPGGKVDAGDAEVHHRCDGTGDAEPEQVTIMAGAIREAFEECGVLLAREPGQDELISGDRLAELDRFRDPLHQGELTLLAFLEEHDLRLACDRLTHFAHWITPPIVPKRFDTHFYLAAAPADHLAIHDGHESVDSVWIAPGEAVSGGEDGTYTIIFPTVRNLEMLAESADVAQAFDAAERRRIVTVLPWMEDRDGDTYLCIPPEAGYAVSEERMPGRPS